MISPKCVRCNDSGYVAVPEQWDTHRTCICTAQRCAGEYAARHGSPDLDGVERLPLDQCKLVVYTPPEWAKIKPRAVVTGYWSSVGAHVRAAVINHGFQSFGLMFSTPSGMKPFTIMSDAQLRELYFRPTPRLGVEDLDGASQATFTKSVVAVPLLVIRLGFSIIGKKEDDTVAAILLEAIRERDRANLITWLVCEPIMPFKKGNHAYSDQLAAYMRDPQCGNYEDISIRVRTDADDLLNTV